MAANVQTILTWVLRISVFFLSNTIATSKNTNYQIVNSNELRLHSENYQVVNVLTHPRLRRDVLPADSSGSAAPGSLPDAQTGAGLTAGPVATAKGLTETNNATDVPPQAVDNNTTVNASTTVAAPSSTTKVSTAASTASTTTAADPFAEADVIHDQHVYYTSEVLKNKVSSFWQELTDIPRHETLSTGHRVAAVIPLKFPFHFYGHIVTNVTVATGGFIYMSPFLHQWLTATQYIAPLMANFDPSMSKDSGIYYRNEDDRFTVEWKNVMLKDQNSSGLFNFQAILHKDDVIHFVYKSVPVSVRSISTDEHPVKIGLSDAYYNDTYLPEYKIKRRTIYEYHKVVVKFDAIATGTVVVLKPLPTCNRLMDCNSCIKHENVKFDCKWCNTIGRCSDGLDWYRQHWDKEGCQQSSESTLLACQPDTTVATIATTRLTSPPSSAPSSRDTTMPLGDESIPSVDAATTAAANSSQTKALTGCDDLANDTDICSSLPQPMRPVTDPLYPASHNDCNHTKDVSGCTALPALTEPIKSSCQNGKCNQKSDFPVAVIVVIVFIICGLLGAIGGWVYYAYTHPTTKSGMWLMEHRPSQIKANIKFWKSSTDAVLV